MTQVKSVMSKMARINRAIAGTDDVPSMRTMNRRDLTSEEKRIARSMARKEATTEQIAKAIKWPYTVGNLGKKLRSINIHPGSVGRTRKGMYVNYKRMEQ